LSLGGVGPNPPPAGNCGLTGLNPKFTFAPTTPIVGQQVCFTSSTTSTSTVIAEEFSFSDTGETVAGSTVCHTFSHSGVFNVTLTSEDANRNVCSTVQTLTVGGGTAPSCSIIVSPTPVAPGQSTN